MAGFTNIRELREAKYDGPVVFFTARVTPERQQAAEELNALRQIVINALGLKPAAGQSPTAEQTV